MTDNVIEPVPIDDVFCTELVKVARVGPCLRLIFATPDAELDNSDGVKVIVARLIIPAEEAEAIARPILEGPPQETRPTHRPKLHLVN